MGLEGNMINWSELTERQFELAYAHMVREITEEGSEHCDTTYPSGSRAEFKQFVRDIMRIGKELDYEEAQRQKGVGQ